MAKAGENYDDVRDEYLELNLNLVYMVDDFFELMLIALSNADQSKNGSNAPSKE